MSGGRAAARLPGPAPPGPVPHQAGSGPRQPPDHRTVLSALGSLDLVAGAGVGRAGLGGLGSGGGAGRTTQPGGADSALLQVIPAAASLAARPAAATPHSNSWTGKQQPPPPRPAYQANLQRLQGCGALTLCNADSFSRLWMGQRNEMDKCILTNICKPLQAF